MATEVKIKELSMNYFVLGENNQVQKVSLKSETMCEKICSIFTENCSLETVRGMGLWEFSGALRELMLKCQPLLSF